MPLRKAAEKERKNDSLMEGLQCEFSMVNMKLQACVVVLMLLPECDVAGERNQVLF